MLVASVTAVAAEPNATFRAAKPVVIEAEADAAAVPVVKKLIFLDFYNESNDPNVKWLTDSIGESIFELTKNKYKYVRIESKVWREHAKSQAFRPQDFYDVDKLQAMGFTLKADGIIFGKFRSSFENIEISGKIRSVVDKEIIAEKKHHRTFIEPNVRRRSGCLRNPRQPHQRPLLPF